MTLKHQGQNTREIATQNRLAVLTTANDNGGWITRPVVEWTIYSNTTNAASRRASATRLLGEIVTEKCLLPRKLPSPQHDLAWVLTRRGACRLMETGMYETPVHNGTGWGKIDKERAWHPPQSWRHDARAAAFLQWACVHLHNALPQPEIPGRPWRPVFENTLQQLDNWNGRKRPDGVLIHAGRHPKAIWVEVEASRKSGKLLLKQIAAMARITAADVDLINVPIAEYPWHAPMTVARTTIVVLPSPDASGAYQKACMGWLEAKKHRAHRILYQLAYDMGRGEFAMGPVVDLRGDGRGNATQQR